MSAAQTQTTAPSITVAELAALLGAQVQGQGGVSISGLAPLDTAQAGQLSFLSNPLYLQQAATTQASVVLLSQRDLTNLSATNDISQRTWLVAANPYACFARAAQWFVARQTRPQAAGISPQASIAADAVVPASCHIGPGVTIASGAKLGERVVLLGNTFVGAGAQIGDDSLFYGNVSLYHGCVVGARCIIHSGAVIGSDGFGFAPDFNAQGGQWVKIPQTGRAVLGDDVEIGANTTIDRGAMADTVIETGCKIDNQVQIAHNVKIGAHCVVAGCAAISGSTKIGRFCIIGGSANFAGHLTIADRTTISGGTSITKSITEPGQHFTSVFPAMPHKEWEKNAAIVRGLGKMRERIRALENQLKTLIKP